MELGTVHGALLCGTYISCAQSVLEISQMIANVPEGFYLLVDVPSVPSTIELWIHYNYVDVDVLIETNGTKRVPVKPNINVPRRSEKPDLRFEDLLKKNIYGSPPKYST